MQYSAPTIERRILVAQMEEQKISAKADTIQNDG